MVSQRIVAVVGARALPEEWAPQVTAVVRHFLARGWGIGSGGASGADDYALRAILAAGAVACRRSVVFLPGPRPIGLGGPLRAFAALGGTIVAGGDGAGREAFLARSRRLARRAVGVVAFLWGPSQGSIYTLRVAARARRRVAVVLAGGGAAVPRLGSGRWEPFTLGGVAAHRWVAAGATEPEPPVAASSLGRIFAVPDGEPVAALLAHISRLTPGERLWFEAGVRVGDQVLVPYERLDDGKPAALAVDRLMRRLRCSAKEAFDLGEALLALDADRTVMAHYLDEARRRGVAPVLAELLAWGARLGALAPVPDADALDHAEPLGDAAEGVDDAGELVASARAPVDSDTAQTPEPAALAWRVLGPIDAPRICCARCRARYVADDDATELPVCPRCGTPDTWEARQPAAFQVLLRAIDACDTREALADLGRRLHAARLPRAQAGVAWTRYRIRQAALEAAVPLSAAARELLAEIDRAEAWVLPRVGAALYRRQHAADAPGLTPPEWRRLWAAYRARRPARPA
jgi:hypothetical protein